MQKTDKDVDFPTKNDGTRDKRYTVPQVINQDGSPDQRYDKLQKPVFGEPHTLIEGDSKFYNPVEKKEGQPGTYILSTDAGKPGPKEAQYVGKEANSGSRCNDHGRGGEDNLSDLTNRAQKQGKDVIVQTADANSTLEERAQEKYLLDKSTYSWNDKDNDGRFAGDKTIDGRQQW
jgi:hypothetical protein